MRKTHLAPILCAAFLAGGGLLTMSQASAQGYGQCVRWEDPHDCLDRHLSGTISEHCMAKSGGNLDAAYTCAARIYNSIGAYNKEYRAHQDEMRRAKAYVPSGPSPITKQAINDSAALYAASTGQLSFTTRSVPVSQDNLDALQPIDWNAAPDDPYSLTPPALRGQQQSSRPRPRPRLFPMAGRPVGLPETGEASPSGVDTLYGNPELNATAIQALARRIEREAGLTPGLLEAVCLTESGLRPLVVSWHGKDHNPKSVAEAVNIENSYILLGEADVDVGICQRTFRWRRKGQLVENEAIASMFEGEDGLRWAVFHLNLLIYSNASRRNGWAAAWLSARRAMPFRGGHVERVAE